MPRKLTIWITTIFSFLFCFVYGQTPQDLFLVPVTIRPSPLLRLQFDFLHDSVLIYGTNLAALPISLKKAKFLNPKAKLNFDNTTRMATATIENNYALQRDTSLGFRSKLTGQSYYKVLKESFLSGKGNSPIFVNQNIRLGGFPAPASWPLNFSANISGAGIYTVTYLPALSQLTLPITDAGVCEKTSQQFEKLRAKEGYGLEKISYKPYNARRRETVRKSFDIFFESGSAQPKGPEMKAITEYLDKNRFEILNAVMEGGSSVEGDEAKNKKLQRDRARLISAALARYNKSAVKKDTILLSDNWPKFREQIKASPQAWLDSLSNEKILKEINSSEKLRKALEPILKTQRKASLNLILAKILTADDQFVTLQKSLNGLLRTLTTSKQPNKELEPQIMGAIAYLFEQHVNNDLNREEVDSLLYGEYMDQKYAYLGIHLVKQFTENKFGAEDKTVWKEKWTTLELEPWFTLAQESLVRLAWNEKAPKADRAKYLKILTDFQAFSYKLTNLGVVEINELCFPRYPEDPLFMALTMNQFSFVHQLADEGATLTQCMAGRKSLNGMAAKSDSTTMKTKPDSLANLAQTQDTILFTIGTGLKRVGFEQRKYIKPSFHKDPKGTYYFMMKQGFLKGNKNMMSSPTSSLSLDAFSLYNLLDANVSNWAPDKNYFFDKEIRLEEMDRLIGTLKRENSICAPIVNSLYINYHQKALQFLELYFEPGSTKHKDIAEASLKFISEYYKLRLKEIEPDMPLKIALYLNHFNWFPGNSEGAWYGYDLLISLSKTRNLNDDELKLLASYLNLYDPELEKPLPSEISKESLMSKMKVGY